jgi:hypothetical protein
MEQLLKLTKKYRASNNPLVDGSAYALGNWWYENYPNLSGEIPQIVMNLTDEQLTIENLQKLCLV